MDAIDEAAKFLGSLNDKERLKALQSLDPKTGWKLLSEFGRRAASRHRGNVPEKVYARRRELGWTQAEVARRANISQSDVSRFECGVTERYGSAICLELGLNRHKIDDRRRSNKDDLTGLGP